MLTAHVDVNGEEAVRFIERSYIQNRDRSLGEIVLAVVATVNTIDNIATHLRLLIGTHEFTTNLPARSEPFRWALLEATASDLPREVAQLLSGLFE